MYETEIFVEENTEEIISENDLINIKITINQLLHDYIEFNIKEWYKYTFHDDMKDSVNNLLAACRRRRGFRDSHKVRRINELRTQLRKTAV